MKGVVPEKGISYDSFPPSDASGTGVKGSASAKEQHNGIQGLEEEEASSEDDDPDD